MLQSQNNTNNTVVVQKKKNQHLGQWNIIESIYFYVSPQSSIYLIFNGDAKNKHWREE